MMMDRVELVDPPEGVSIDDNGVITMNIPEVGVHHIKVRPPDGTVQTLVNTVITVPDEQC